MQTAIQLSDISFRHECSLLADRYGFRSPPHLELKARPKLGEREVTLVHVTDWIEKKLDQEFQVNPKKKMQTLSHEYNYVTLFI